MAYVACPHKYMAPRYAFQWPKHFKMLMHLFFNNNSPSKREITVDGLTLTPPLAPHHGGADAHPFFSAARWNSFQHQKLRLRHTW